MTDKDKWNKRVYELENRTKEKLKTRGLVTMVAFWIMICESLKTIWEFISLLWRCTGVKLRVYVEEYNVRIWRKLDLRSCFSSSNKHVSVDLWGNVETKCRYSNSQDAQ